MKEHNDEVIKKYKKSIFIDLFVSFVPMSTVIFCTHVFTNMFGYFGRFIMFGILLLLMVFYLMSDIVFSNQSIGKRIYKIKVVNAMQNTKITFYFVVYRRILDAFYNPLFGKSFFEKCMEIDRKTGTIIVVKK
jgi:uncharacterized RDD family membrane protein YckC